MKRLWIILLKSMLILSCSETHSDRLSPVQASDTCYKIEKTEQLTSSVRELIEKPSTPVNNFELGNQNQTDEKSKVPIPMPEELVPSIYKYELDGHLITTFAISTALDTPLNNNYLLAYYSEYPDIEWEYKATTQFWNIFKLKFRRGIMSELHSLHGGDADKVEKRRNVLAKLIASEIKKDNIDRDYVKLGLLVHAFGDSYAHTKRSKDGVEEAYGHGFGHLWDSKTDHDPDRIELDDAIENYRIYINRLWKLFQNGTATDPKILNELNSIANHCKTNNCRIKDLYKLNRLKSINVDNTKMNYYIECMNKRAIKINRDYIIQLVNDISNDKNIEI